MKRFFVVIALIIEFFILYYLQVNFFSAITIFGISPNLIVMFILFIGLFANQTSGIVCGVIFGLIIDLASGSPVGITAFMLCIIGYLGSYFDKNFSKENKITIILMVAGATIIYEIGYYLLRSFILEFNREYLNVVRIIAIETLYNVLLSIIFYPLFKKIGYSMDRTFKKNNILTRYF